MKKTINRLVFIVLIFHGLIAVGQDGKGADTTSTQSAQGTSTQNTAGQSVEMADKMRSEGKIYVVVAVVLVVLTGLILYLFTVDRKLSRLEKQLQEKR